MGIYGGVVCFDGSVGDSNGLGCFERYVVQYAPLPAAAPFLGVDPAIDDYLTPVTNDPLASWNTRSGATSVPDGNYRVRVWGFDECGNNRVDLKDIRIDNTAPIGVINTPIECANVSGRVEIRGTATDANLAGWVLQYIGGDATTWVTIASGNSNAVNRVLANWDTSELRACAYVVRLIVSDRASVDCGSGANQTEYAIGLNVGCRGDFNRDGFVNSQDYFDFITALFSGCQ